MYPPQGDAAGRSFAGICISAGGREIKSARGINSGQQLNKQVKTDLKVIKY